MRRPPRPRESKGIETCNTTAEQTRTGIVPVYGPIKQRLYSLHRKRHVSPATAYEKEQEI